MLNKGELVFLVTRRLFDGDIRRHFVGIVTEVSAAVARLDGFAFVFDPSVNEFVRRDELRTRLIPLFDAGLVFTILPGGIDLEKIRYTTDQHGQRILTDGLDFSMVVSEFGPGR